MVVIDEGDLRFTFPDDWQVLKYDNSRFYRNCFENFADSKGVDFIAFHPEKSELYLIEVKDYITEKQKYKSADKKQKDEEDTTNKKRKDIDRELFKAVALKVRDTLAGLVVLAHKTSFDDEQKFALKAIKKSKKRIILHRQPHNRELKREINKFYKPSKSNRLDKNLQNKDTFITMLEAVDPKAILCSMKNMPKNCAWEVERISTQQI